MLEGTYTTRIVKRSIDFPVETNECYVCAYRYANVATYDLANIELARTTNMFRWNADICAGTVTPWRGSGTCFAKPYTTIGTTWYVMACFRPAATGFGYSGYKTVSGHYRNWDFGFDSQATKEPLHKASFRA